MSKPVAPNCQISLKIVFFFETKKVPSANRGTFRLLVFVYNNLKKKGIDLLLDDRDLKMGNKLNDFELMGIPYAIIIGSKEAEKSITTIMTRKDSSKTSVSPEDIFKIISGK